MENDVIVLSPEKTILTFRLASIGSRAMAQIVDLIAIIISIVLFSLFASFTLGIADEGLASGAIFVFASLFIFAYFVLLEGLWNGQTIGKKMMSIRVRLIDGTPITFASALGRNLLRVADFLPGAYFIGMFAVFTNPRAQRIGDLVAGTVVCLDKLPEPRFQIAPHVVGIHPMESYVGDLKGMTVEEYNALRRFADRFPELPQPIQDRLTREVWTPIAERRNVPKVPKVDPIFLAEAVVMKYGREHGLL